MKFTTKSTLPIEQDQTLYMHDPRIVIASAKPAKRRPIDNMIVAPTSS